MKKLILFLTLLFVGLGATFEANAQYSPSNNLNYIKLLKTPPIGSVEDSVIVYDSSSSFVKMLPKSSIVAGKESISNKTSTISDYDVDLYPNEKATHDALDLKLNISDLPTNLTLYPTTTASDVSGYVVMVKDIHDVRYNTTAVDVSTPTITTTDQLVSQRISDAGVLIGQPGVFNITTFGNIRHLSGSGTATFYFKVFHRDSLGVETLICTSSVSAPVTNGGYSEFTASGVWNDGDFVETDKIVIKSYANRIAGGSDPVYQFQFGGTSPVRTLLPVPFSVVDAGYELKSNKQNDLTPDGTGTKYPTVDAVNALKWIKSNESLSFAQRKGDILYGILDQYTGEEITLLKVAEIPVVDGIVYFQLGSEYFKRVCTKINVKWFGAIGDGIADDSYSVNKAISYLSGNINTLHFPKGTYLIDSQVINKSNITIYGDGIGVTFFKAKNIDRAQFFFESDSPTSFFSNIHFYDFTILGLVDTLGFSEFKHLISMGGVENVLIERVGFNGFRGDGLMLASSITAGIERHNKNVVVQNCVFDGLNKDNRNAISVVDCENLIIKENTFKNCTKVGMPGAVDLEPNPLNTWGIFKNINILNNTFENIGGDGGIIINTQAVVLTNPINKITIKNNVFKNGCNYSGDIRIATIETLSNIKNMDISIDGNYSDTEKSPFLLWKTKGVKIANNSFINASSATVGKESSSDLGASDVVMVNNLFVTKSPFFGCVYFSTVENIIVSNNIFKITDLIDNKYAILFIGNGAATTSSNVSITNNLFKKGQYQTHTIYKSGTHTFANYLTNVFSNNIFEDTLLNNFPFFKQNLEVDNGSARENFVRIKSGRSYAIVAKQAGDSRLIIRDESAGRDDISIELDGSLRPLIGYKSADGSVGLSNNFTTKDGKLIGVKNGIITSVSDSVYGYKVYTALLTQVGTNAPTAIVLENTIGAIVWSRTTIGGYFATLSGAFTTDKTSVLITNGSANSTYIHGAQVSTSNVNVITVADGQIDKATVEIRVYN